MICTLEALERRNLLCAAHGAAAGDIHAIPMGGGGVR